jgi:hypothetical protein
MTYLAFRVDDRAGYARSYHAGDLVDAVDMAQPSFGVEGRKAFAWVRCDDLPSTPIRLGMHTEDAAAALRRRRFRVDIDALVASGVASAAWLAACRDRHVSVPERDCPLVSWSVLLAAMRDKDDPRATRRPAAERIEEHLWDREQARLDLHAADLGRLTREGLDAQAFRDTARQLRDAAKALADADDAVRP